MSSIGGGGSGSSGTEASIFDLCATGICSGLKLNFKQDASAAASAARLATQPGRLARRHCFNWRAAPASLLLLLLSIHSHQFIDDWLYFAGLNSGVGSLRNARRRAR